MGYETHYEWELIILWASGCASQMLLELLYVNGRNATKDILRPKAPEIEYKEKEKYSIDFVKR